MLQMQRAMMGNYTSLNYYSHTKYKKTSRQETMWDTHISTRGQSMAIHKRFTRAKILILILTLTLTLLRATTNLKSSSLDLTKSYIKLIQYPIMTSWIFWNKPYNVKFLHSLHHTPGDNHKEQILSWGVFGVLCHNTCITNCHPYYLGSSTEHLQHTPMKKRQLSGILITYVISLF